MESFPVYSKLRVTDVQVQFRPCPRLPFIPWHLVTPATLNPSFCIAIELLDSLLIFDLLI